MQHIPFTIGNIEGFLHVMDKTSPPKWFHVMERTPQGNFYQGQLMLNPNLGWWLPDSKFEAYAGQLGELVQAWFC